MDDIAISNDLIEIHDPEIDVDEIMQQIRERIHQRYKTLEYSSRVFPTFGAAAYPGEPEDGDFDADLYYHLRKVNDVYTQIGVDLILAPSPATRIPILGCLWKRIRRGAHNLVLFYIGKLTEKQVTVNRHLVSTLNRMAVQLQAQEEDLKAMRRELERLRG